MEEQELRRWVSRLGEGDREAFPVVYEETKGHVYRLVAFLIGNRQDTHDVVSEVYMELVRSARLYDTDKPFRSWLSGLIVRQTSSWNRKRWRRLRLIERNRALMEREPEWERAESRLLTGEQRSELLSLVEGLSYKLRSVVVLRYYQECTFEEIAELLDIPLGTAKSRHHKALEQLRKKASGMERMHGEGLFHVH